MIDTWSKYLSLKTSLTIEIACGDFFENLSRLHIEENAGTGRTYFLDKHDRILAVGKPRTR
jgi:hypothetical protein